MSLKAITCTLRLQCCSENKLPRVSRQQKRCSVSGARRGNVFADSEFALRPNTTQWIMTLSRGSSDLQFSFFLFICAQQLRISVCAWFKPNRIEQVVNWVSICDWDAAVDTGMNQGPLISCPNNISRNFKLLLFKINQTTQAFSVLDLDR